MTSANKNDLLNQAKSESKLMSTYGVKVPIQGNILHSSSQVDYQSVGILEMFHPVMNSVNLPLQTYGDGNCLYRAISLALTGTQDHHVQLRLITAIELIENRTLYDTKRKHNDFLRDVRIVTSDYEKLMTEAIKDKSYAEMAHIYALGAALCLPINSYYPPQINSELSSAFTRTVYGRKVKEGSPSKVCVMWTSMAVPETPKNFQVNHFVPLINKTSCVNIVAVDCTAHTEKTSVGNAKDHSEIPVNEHLTEISDTGACLPTDLSSVEEPLETNEGICNSTVLSSVNDASYTEGTCNADCPNDDYTDLVHHNSYENEDASPFGSSDTEKVNDSFVSVAQNEQVCEAETKTDANTCNESSQFSLPIGNPDKVKGRLENGQVLESVAISSLLRNTKSGLPRIPGGLKENVYFVIDNSENFKKKSLKKSCTFSDDCGFWDRDSGASPKSYYLLQESGNLSNIFLRNGQYCYKRQVQRKTEYIPLNPQPDANQVVVLQRYYTHLKLDSRYKKRVSWFANGGLQSNLAVVEYVGNFPGLAPHGNSRQQTEYIRTPAEVMSEVKEMAGKQKPHQIYNTLKNKYDEISRPTGLQQINDKIKYEKAKEKKHVGHTNNIADQINRLENMVSEGHNFVRSIIRNSKRAPCIILYNDEQMTDLKNLCCTGQTVLGIDKTFMLCKMHVTVTCYKQLTVTRTRTDKPPIFLGPLFIHDNSDYDTYSHFFHHLKIKLTDTNLTRLVIGTDDEQALVKAITTVIPEATHVLCTRHLKENARQKLTDDAVDVQNRNAILSKLFGHNGIANADDTISFHSKCDEFEDYCSDVSSSFLQYFNGRLKKHLKAKVNEPVRDDLISANWTNNNCESVNHVLKQTVDWKSKSLTDFVDLVEQLVVGQFKDLRGALIGTGEFRLAESHKQFQITKTNWISMSEQQKANLYKRYRKYVKKDTDLVISTDGQSTVVAPKTNGRKPGPQRKRKINIRTVTITKKKK